MNKFFNDLLDVVKFRQMKVISLGLINNNPLFFITRPISNGDKKPHLLLTAGFHGNEQGGSYGLLDFLQHAEDSLFEKVNLSFLPAVNPSGMQLGSRNNYLGQNPNRGYVSMNNNGRDLSIEGQLLVANLKEIFSAGADGVLSLHEDDDPLDKVFYVFTYEQADRPGIFSETILKAGANYFPQMQDGYVEDTIVKDGIAFNDFDGTFEHRLFYEGIPLVACTETPSGYPLEDRIGANRAIAEEFVKYFIK